MAGYRIIVVSDTHGNFNKLHQIVEDRKYEAHAFIHLGDGARELDDIRTLYPDLRILHVRGNCDYSSDSPVIDRLTAGGKEILFTHGHDYDVKRSLDKLKKTAREHHADIILYGHTHQSSTNYEKGLYIMNPGSPTQPRNGPPSYGVIDITCAGIVLNIVKM